jgi:hypothetical protein
MHRYLLLAFLTASTALAQAPSAPPNFRLVMPHEPGAILIDTAGGWQLDRAILGDQGKRPILQMHNDSLGIVASYILDHDPPYYESSESCRNDALGTIMAGPLAKPPSRTKRATPGWFATDKPWSSARILSPNPTASHSIKKTSSASWRTITPAPRFTSLARRSSPAKSISSTPRSTPSPTSPNTNPHPPTML